MVHIIKKEPKTSGCDKDGRVKQFEILLKTYQGGRVALEKETILQGIVASFKQKLVNRV